MLFKKPWEELRATKEGCVWRLSEVRCVCTSVKAVAGGYPYQILSQYLDFKVTTLEEMRTRKIWILGVPSGEHH